MKGNEIITAKFKMISLVLVITMLLQILMPVLMPLKSIASTPIESSVTTEKFGDIKLSTSKTGEIAIGDEVIIDVSVTGTGIDSIEGYINYDTTIFEEIDTTNNIITKYDINEGSGFDESENAYYVLVTDGTHKGTNNAGNDSVIFSIKLIAKVATNESIISINGIWLTRGSSSGGGSDTGIDEAGYDISLTFPGETSECTVTYNKNTTDEVTNMPTNTTVNAGTSYTIGGEPKREGYAFTGWQTADGTPYVAGTAYQITSNLDLYAQWRELNKYTITYNKNTTDEVTGMPTNSGTKTEGIDYTIAPAPSRTGYTFEAWNTLADGTGTSYVAESLYRLDENVELFAKWVPVKSTLTVDPNGGTWEGNTTSQDFIGEYKTTKQIPNPTSTPKGYLINFDGNGGITEELIKEQTTTFDRWTLTDGGTFSGNTYTFGTESGTLRATYIGNNITLPTASKLGSTMKGWYTAPTGGTLIGQPGDNYLPDGPKRLFAQWDEIGYELTINPAGGIYKGTTEPTIENGNYEDTIVLETPKAPSGYTITLDNDGTITTVEQKKTFNRWVKSGKGTIEENIYTFEDGNGTLTATYTPREVELETPTKDGYEFEGWFTLKTGGTKVESGFMPEENTTLYAHWKAKKYTITFNPGEGATVSQGTKEVTYGEKYGDLPEPVKTGKTFAGWWKGDILITKDNTVDILENTTLTARWSDAQYILTIDLNGGTVDGNQTVEPIRGNYNESVTLPTVKGPEGFTVTLNKNDGTNTTNEIKQTTRLEKWTKADGTDLAGTTTYVFDASNDKITASYIGESVTLEPPSTRPNYVFKAWYTQAEGGEKVETGFIPTSNITLYAHWEGKKHTITFKPGDGITVIPETKEVEYGKPYGELPTPTKPGATFEGWYDGETPITPETLVEITQDIELTAKWKDTEYTLTIDLNGGTVDGNLTVVPIKGTRGQEVSLPEAKGPEGFTVTLNKNDGTNTTEEIKQPKTLEKWTKADGTELTGTKYTFGETDDTITASYIESSVDLKEPTERLGYTFKGWYTETETGTKVEPGFTPTANTILYAHWEANKYTITFDAGEGATVTPNEMEVTFGSKYGTLPTPTKPGGVFGGWYNGETPITPETVVEITEDTVLTAKWTGEKYTLTIDLAGGNVGGNETVAPIQGEVGETVTLPTVEGPEGFTITVNNNDGVTANREEKQTTRLEKWTKEDGTDLAGTTTYVFGAKNEKITASYIGNEINVQNPTERQGYTFKGWYTEAENGEKIEMPYIPEADITIYAHWEGEKHTVTFDGGEGVTVTPGTKQVELGKAYGDLPEPNKTGYEFKGWFTDIADETTRVTEQTIFETRSDVTLIAKWEAKKYTITLDAGEGATVDTTSKEVTYGETYGELPTPTKPGATFDGWFIGETEITEDKIVEITEDVDLIAKWTNIKYTLTVNLNGGKVGESTTVEPIKGIYNQTVDLPQAMGPLGFTVTLNKNDGTNTTEEIKLPKTLDKWTKADGTELTGTTYTFGEANETITASYVESSVELEDAERTNYIFKGWFTDPINGTKIEAGFVPTANTILYAHWEGEKHTITLDAGEGATVDTTSKEVTYGETYGELPTPTKPGATFDGWFIGETEITEDKIVEITEDVDLIAKWTNIKYTLTVNLNGGKVGESTTVEPIKGIYNQTVDLPQAMGPLGFTVTLNKNDGTNTTEEIKLPKTLDKWTKADGTELTGTTYTFGEANETITASYVESNVELEDAERPGYEFKGWFTDITDETTKVETGFIPTSNITLTAKWEARKYTITFNPGEGATVSIRTKRVTYGEKYGTLPEPTKSGYSFEGWYNGETQITEDTLVEITEDTELTAKWGGKQFTVTFDYGDGTSTSKTVTNGKPYGELPIPTKEGYKFNGWYDKNNNKIESTTIAELTKDIILYAKFTANEYIVVFRNDDGSAIEAITVKHGENAEYTGETPQKKDVQKGYKAEFKGWNNSEKLQNVIENITVTATYEITPIIYTITYKNTDGVENSQNPTSYTIESENIILKDLANQGKYEFLGWYTSEDDETAEKVTSIDTSKLENIILYARWDESKLYLRSSVYKIGENDIDRYEPNDVYLDKIQPKTTLSKFINNCKTNGIITVIDKQGQQLEQNDIVGTEMTIKVTKGNEEINLTAVVMGDTDGDGYATATDMSDMKDVILKTKNLEGAKFKAADIDDTKKVTSTDLSDINRAILKLTELIYIKK